MLKIEIQLELGFILDGLILPIAIESKGINCARIQIIMEFLVLFGDVRKSKHSKHC